MRRSSTQDDFLADRAAWFSSEDGWPYALALGVVLWHVVYREQQHSNTSHTHRSMLFAWFSALYAAVMSEAALSHMLRRYAGAGAHARDAVTAGRHPVQGRPVRQARR